MEGKLKIENEKTIVGFLKSRLNKDKNYNICLAGEFCKCKVESKIMRK